MSFRALKWSYSLRDLTGPEKAVLNCLAWHHNGKSGQCNPSSKLLAAETGFAIGTVNKCLVSLAQKGLIDEVADPQLGRVYTLAIVEPDVLPESSNPAPTEQAYIEQESKTKKELGRSRANSDSGWKKDWRAKPPAPMSDFRAIAEKRAAEFKAVIAPTAQESKTDEERATIAERMRLMMRGLTA
jgi:hypothetical protein